MKLSGGCVVLLGLLALVSAASDPKEKLLKKKESLMQQLKALLRSVLDEEDGKKPLYNHLARTPNEGQKRQETDMPEDITTMMPGSTTMMPEMPGNTTMMPEMPGNTTMMPEMPGNTTMMPEMPGNTTMMPEMPGNTAMMPEMPGNTAMMHEMPGNTAMMPEMPGSTTMMPEIPGNTTMMPEMPGNTTMMPDMPGNTTMIPLMPGNTTMMPDMPGNTTIMPEMPDNTTIMPQMPGNTTMMPDMPGNTTMMPEMPANTTMMPKMPGNTTMMPEMPGNTTMMPGNTTVRITVYAGLYSQGRLPAIVETVDDLMHTLSIDDIEELRNIVDVLAYKLRVGVQEAKELLIHARDEYRVQTLDDLKTLMSRDEFAMDLDFGEIYNRVILLGVQGMLNGTKEHMFVAEREVGCGSLRHNVDVVCVVNRIYNLFNAMQLYSEKVLKDIFKHDCFASVQESCFVRDCFLVHDYLLNIDVNNFDSSLAVDAAAKNVECVFRNINIIMDDFHPTSPYFSIPRYMMSKLLQYVSYTQLLAREYNWASRAFHSLNDTLATVMSSTSPQH